MFVLELTQKEMQITNRKTAFSMNMIGTYLKWLIKISLEWQTVKGSKNVKDTSLTSLWITTLILKYITLKVEVKFSLLDCWRKKRKQGQ